MEALKTVAAIVCIFVLLPILILKGLGYMTRMLGKRRRREHPEKFPGTPQYISRLRAPQFDELARALGRPLPAVFRRLHEEADLLLTTNFYLLPLHAKKISDACEVMHFFPAQPATLGEVWGSDHAGRLPIAVDGVGDVYYQLLDQSGSDSAVYVYHHDGGDFEKIADSLQEFLAWERLSFAAVEARLA